MSMGKGYLLKGEFFIKRYKYFPPGLYESVKYRLSKKNTLNFDKLKRESLQKLIHIFSEYEVEIKTIYKNYYEYSHKKDHRIIDFD